MDMFICNKCLAPTYRGKTPFYLTQCGHIYCHGCMQQAEKQCPRCQQTNIFSVELQQPSLARVENLITPLNESLQSLHKIYEFQNAQVNITLQRFLELDKKYDNLKSSYFNLIKYTKELKDKYIKLKEERAKDAKKQIYGMHNSTLHSLSDASTPANSDIHRIANARNVSNSYFSSCDTKASQYSNIAKDRNLLSGFRIPYPHSARSMSSRGTSNKNSNYSFRT